MTGLKRPKEDQMVLRVGDWVEVRSKEEILRTLDKNGRLENLPFMPQMFNYCGKRLRVYKSAHKTCDTVSPNPSGRAVSNAVHLDVRCDGEAFAGCQTACLIFWKEAWLKPVSGGPSSKEAEQDKASKPDKLVGDAGCTEEMVLKSTWAPDAKGADGKRYFCQATELVKYTTPLPWWDLRQYVQDYVTGNSSLGRILGGAIYSGYFFFARKNKFGIGKPFRWLYDKFQALVGGVPYPRRDGLIPSDQPTPTVELNLKAGDLVRVKSYPEILATLNSGSLKNRGMSFDAELVPYCGGIYRVKTRVETFISEQTGRVRTLKTPAVILEGVWCKACYSHLRMGCPRSLYSWWREVWLERVDEHTAEQRGPGTSQCGSSNRAPSEPTMT
jgi:hypothetical protein